MGLAEDAAALSALKVLHALLDGNQRRPPGQRVAFVALSNTLLDAAKLNCGTCFLVEHADDVAPVTRAAFARLIPSPTPSPRPSPMLAAVMAAWPSDITGGEWFGMRDYYAFLAHWLHALPAAPDLQHAIQAALAAFAANFGGGEHDALVLRALPLLRHRVTPLLADLGLPEQPWAAVRAAALTLPFVRASLSASPATRRHVLLVYDRVLLAHELRLLLLPPAAAATHTASSTPRCTTCSTATLPAPARRASPSAPARDTWLRRTGSSQCWWRRQTRCGVCAPSPRCARRRPRSR